MAQETSPAQAPGPDDDAVASAEPSVVSSRQPAKGDLIDDRFRLVSMLGEGGMGAVWIAHNEVLDIEVALKFVNPDLGEGLDELLSNRLLREARATAKLGHPAIVRIFDFGSTPAGLPYFAMELLEGEDLGHALERRGRIKATKAVRTMLPVMHALAAAHAQEIVHRDIKPENIVLTRTADGKVQPKLIDFGIAQLERKTRRRLTEAGSVLGTPDYMSPEQARGLDVDHRADIWAATVVLYEMVAGLRPFEAKNHLALIRKIIEQEPIPITELSAGDDDLWTILAKGLAKKRDSRWQSIHEMGDALARWLIGRGVTQDVCGSSLETVWLRSEAPRSSISELDSLYPSKHDREAESSRELETAASPAGAETQVSLASAATPVPEGAPTAVSMEPAPATPPDPSKLLWEPEPAEDAERHASRPGAWRWIVGLLLVGIGGYVGWLLMPQQWRSEVMSLLPSGSGPDTVQDAPATARDAESAPDGEAMPTSEATAVVTASVSAPTSAAPADAAASTSASSPAAASADAPAPSSPPRASARRFVPRPSPRARPRPRHQTRDLQKPDL